MTMRITIPPKEFEKLRANERFILLLRLARYVNQLGFCLASYPGSINDPSPSESRQIFNSMLFSAGVLYEALRIIPSLHRPFKHFPSYKQGFEKLWSDKNTHYLKEKILPKMRNSIIFHVDQEPIEEQLKKVKFSTYVFVARDESGSTPDHFQLADDIALNHILRDATDDAHGEVLFKDIVNRIYKGIVDYDRSAFTLIAEYAERKQWTFET